MAYPPSALTETNEANICSPMVSSKTDSPPIAEGPSDYDEWLEECVPPLVTSESEDDDNHIVEDDSTDDDDSTDEEDEDADGQEELEMPRSCIKRTAYVRAELDVHEYENGQDKKRARKPEMPEKPDESREVHPPRQIKEEVPRDEKFARKFCFTGKEGKEGKIRKVEKEDENHFCIPETHPKNTRPYLLLLLF